MAPNGAAPKRAAREPSTALRALVRFWTALVILLVAGALVLQWLGPLPERPTVHLAAAIAQAPAASVAPQPSARPIPPQPSSPIAPPDPALLEASPENPKALLPRIATNGLSPMVAYAASFDQSDPRPRIGLVIAGIGLSTKESQAAIDHLPGAVTLAFSPYAPDPADLLQQARSKGHEVLISLPLEPSGYPLNDAGNESLLIGAPPGQNLRHLDWVLSRIKGYVGATGAMDGLFGERFAAAPDLLDTLERRLAARGLIYIDPRPGKPDPALVAGRTVDIIVDQPPIEPVIKANLGKLEKLARAHGNALGLVGVPGPRTLSIVTAWVETLPLAGFVLAPATALLHHPAPSPKRAGP